MRNKLFYFGLILSLVLVAGNVLAQGPPNEGSLFESVNDVPVDGGIMLVLAAGVGYGIRTLSNRKK